MFGDEYEIIQSMLMVLKAIQIPIPKCKEFNAKIRKKSDKLRKL
jgi:hypothetical protein